MDPEGTVWPGLKSIEEIVARLREAADRLETPTAPLAGWSLDAIYYGSRRVSRHDLDKVSTERAVGVLNASGHILNVNSRALELAGMLKPGIDHPGIPLGEDGMPTGEMKGPDAMAPLGVHTGFDRDLLACDEPGLRRFAKLCVRTGVTTAADLANLLPDDAVDMMVRVTAEPDYPARIVSLRRFYGVTPEELIAHVLGLRERSQDNMRLGIIKVVADGSIQGEAERIRVADALRTITLGAAYTFKLDGEVGSIETGKCADFAVLEDDPETVGGEALKDVRVWGTVQGGRIFAAADL